MVHEIKSKKEFEEIIGGDKISYIDFYTNWCGPCKQISPVFAKLEKDFEDIEGIAFHKVNIDDVPEVAQVLAISSIPTFHAYKDGVQLEKLVGANPARLAALIQTGLTHL